MPITGALDRLWFGTWMFQALALTLYLFAMRAALIGLSICLLTEHQKPLFQLDPRVTGIFGTSRPSLCTWNRDRMRLRCLLQRALDPTLIGCQ